MQSGQCLRLRMVLQVRVRCAVLVFIQLTFIYEELHQLTSPGTAAGFLDDLLKSSQEAEFADTNRWRLSITHEKRPYDP